MSVYHNGDDISNGSCEDAASPLVGNATANHTGNATFVQSVDYAYVESHSFKLTTVSDGDISYVNLHAATPDLLGLTAGILYTFSCWIYVPSTNTAPVSCIGIDLGDWVSGIQYNSALASVSDVWQQLVVSYTIRSNATRVYCRIVMNTFDNVAGDCCYVDQLVLGHPQDTPWWTPTRSSGLETHSGNIITQRTAAVADGGLANTKYYGTGEYNFREPDTGEPSEFKIEFISKNGTTFTVTSY